MSIALDVITVLILISLIYISYKKGLLRSLVELLGGIAAYVAAYFLSIPLGNWLDKMFIGNYVKGTISGYLKAKSDSSTQSVMLNLTKNLPEAIQKSVSGMGGGIKAAGDRAADDIAGAISSPIALLLGRGIAFFAVFAACIIIIAIIARFSDILGKIPLLGTANSLGGVVIGVLEAVLALFIFSLLVSVLVSFFSISKNPPITASQVADTHVYKYIQNINPLTGMLLKK